MVVRHVLREALPWTTFLPDEDLDEMLTEVMAVNRIPLAVLLAQWRHTAEIYADPDLLAILTAEPEGDLGPVPVPDGDHRRTAWIT